MYIYIYMYVYVCIYIYIYIYIHMPIRPTRGLAATAHKAASGTGRGKVLPQVVRRRERDKPTGAPSNTGKLPLIFDGSELIVHEQQTLSKPSASR